MADPLVSLVVPTRGGAARLPRLLDALAAQDDHDFEVVVVVDGDIDGTAKLLESRSDLALHTVVFTENRGRSAALNAGFRTALGEVLVRCDDDLAPRPDYVRRHRQSHEGAPVGVVGLYRNVLPRSAYTTAYGDRASELLLQDAYSVAPDRRWRYWAGNCSITRDTWERVGPYDENVFRAYGWEDVDYGYRLHLADIPVALDPDLETDHHIAAQSAKGRAVRALYSGAARRRFEEKHAAGDLFSSNIPPRAWNRLVHATARHLDEKRAGQAGEGLDRLLPKLPRPVATKLVALLVEAAHEAGHARPEAVGHAI